MGSAVAMETSGAGHRSLIGQGQEGAGFPGGGAGPRRVGEWRRVLEIEFWVLCEWFCCWRGREWAAGFFGFKEATLLECVTCFQDCSC